MLLDPIPPVRVAPERNAVLLLDVQRAFTSRCHGLGAAQQARGIAREFDEYHAMVDAALPGIARLLSVARGCGALVVHALLARDAPDSPLSLQWRAAGIALPSASALDAELSVPPASQDHVFARGAHSPFSAPGLLPLLRARGIRRVMLGGMMAGATVAPAARELADRDFAVVVLNDATASETMEWHATLMQGLLGGLIRVQSTDDAIEMLEGTRT
jgi:nicotinamidase-related amidase